MFEDAPVNTGAVQWPDTDSAFWTVRRTQLKLHRWASEDRTRRFGDLFNLVYDPAFLMHAWERVSSNAGARTAGMDRVTVAQIVARGGVEVFLGQIRDLLKSGKYEPVQVRRVTIPKASGKFRQLGIPTVADRVVQASLKAVLEPIFEADFVSCSYGFRPNRRARTRWPNPLLGQPLPRVGAGGRHPGVFRRDRTHAATGTGGNRSRKSGSSGWSERS